MPLRGNHIHDLPKIALAIKEYKTTHQTQKECAAKHGIPYKVFSYYFLNGFKKNQKVGGGLIPEETPYQKKAKGRANNYDVIIVGDENADAVPPTPQFHPPPVNHTYIPPPPKPQPVVKQQKTVVAEQQMVGGNGVVRRSPAVSEMPSASAIQFAKEKLMKASTINASGRRRVDIDTLF